MMKRNRKGQFLSLEKIKKGKVKNLQWIKLPEADLQGANLRGADLRGASLRGANLQRANLRSADLRGADLRGADLQEADFGLANLRRANLRGVGCGLALCTLHRPFFLHFISVLIMRAVIGAKEGYEMERTHRKEENNVCMYR
jgi:uncharacterized protein YjbI with pentapeptide repeats